jgi:Flp pilus assembly protein TadD
MPKPDAVQLKKKLAVALVAHREWAAASGPLLELRTARPGDADIHFLLGSVFREQGLFEQAEASYETAIRLDPSNAHAHEGLAILREVRGDKGDGALDEMRTAIRLNPDEGAFHNNLGFALYVRGRYIEAEAALQEGLRHDPLARRMRNNLGFVYGKLGEYRRAQREFEHAGSDDAVENNLGYVYEQASANEAACSHYQLALAKNPESAVAAANAERVCGKSAERRGP